MVFTECSLHALPGWKNIVPERTYLALDSILRNLSSVISTILSRFILSRDKWQQHSKFMIHSHIVILRSLHQWITASTLCLRAFHESTHYGVRHSRHSSRYSGLVETHNLCACPSYPPGEWVVQIKRDVVLGRRWPARRSP